MYETGYAPGIPQDEFERTQDEIYGKEGDEADKAEAKAVQAAKEPPGAEKPATDEEAALADLERQWQAIAPLVAKTMLPEEHAELERSAAAVADAEKRAAGYEQAASCLTGAGV